MSSEQRESRADRRKRYEQVLDAIEHNTGGADHPQPPGIRKPNLMVVLVLHGSLTVSEAESALKAARENEDVVRYEGRAGRWRYIRATEDAFRDLIGAENQRENPRTELIEWAVDRIAEVASDR